jgi:hypothetical protein
VKGVFIMLPVALILGVCPTAAANDDDPTWIASLRLGPAWTDADAVDGAGTEIGLSLNGGVGFAVRENLVLAVELAASRRGSEWVGAVWLPAATFYPGAAGFYLRGGLGVSSIESLENVDLDPETDLGSDTVTEAEGFGLMAGLGFDWEVAPGLVAGPRAEAAWLNLEDERTVSVVSVTLGGGCRW